MRIFQFHEGQQNKLYDLLQRARSNKLFRVLSGGMIGTGAGWLYWEFIGCYGGTCPIISNAPKTIIIFSLFGMWYNYKK